jgi:hypothetical protein
MPQVLESRWLEFLTELDSLLDEEYTFHCIGGFAVIAAYGLPRSSNDLDYYTMTPADKAGELERIAGRGSRLHKIYGVFIQKAAVATLPENYEDRLKQLFPGQFRHLRLLVPDPYDLILSKLSRNILRDREDAKYIVKTRRLDAEVLEARYREEMRALLIGPLERHDNTLRFWIEDFFSES